MTIDQHLWLMCGLGVAFGYQLGRIVDGYKLEKRKQAVEKLTEININAVVYAVQHWKDDIDNKDRADAAYCLITRLLHFALGDLGKATFIVRALSDLGYGWGISYNEVPGGVRTSVSPRICGKQGDNVDE